MDTLKELQARYLVITPTIALEEQTMDTLKELQARYLVITPTIARAEPEGAA